MQFDHYTIRLLTLDDTHAFYLMVDKNRARLEDFFTGTVSRTATMEATKEFVADITRRAEERTYFPYVIIDNTNHKIIGYLDLKNIDWTIPKAEMGGYMDEGYAGKGITAKAFEVFCAHCFEIHGFQKLCLRTHHSNTAARRIAEKSGFEVEGTIRRDYKTTSGELVDLIYYGKLR